MKNAQSQTFSLKGGRTTDFSRSNIQPQKRCEVCAKQGLVR